MNVGLYSTKILAEVLAQKDRLSSDYARLPDVTYYWAFLDLESSSNFRLVAGPHQGYVRGCLFFSLIDEVVRSCRTVRRFKEMGDGALLVSSDYRELFECLILIDQVAHQLADLEKNPAYPFGIRSAMGFGTAKKLPRSHEDYLGSSIDRLARIAGVKSTTSDLFIDEEAYRNLADGLDKEYGKFISVSEVIQMGEASTKGMLKAVYYREIRIDRTKIGDFDEFFQRWREQLNPPKAEL